MHAIGINKQYYNDYGWVARIVAAGALGVQRDCYRRCAGRSLGGS